MPAKDRAAILLDADALTKAKLMDPADLMQLISAYSAEDDCVVWDALAMVLSAVDKAVVGIDSVHPHFKKMAASIVDPAMARLGWEPKASDSHLTKLMRSTVISLLARFSADPALLDEARRRFEAVVEDPADVAACPTDFRVRHVPRGAAWRPSSVAHALSAGVGRALCAAFHLFDRQTAPCVVGVLASPLLTPFPPFCSHLPFSSSSPPHRWPSSPWWRPRAVARSTTSS